MTKRPHAIASEVRSERLATHDDIVAIVNGTHRDPFAVLGMQQAGAGFVACCFIPHAEAVTAYTLAGRKAGELTCLADAGFFEGKLSIRKRQPLRYHASNAGGEWWLADP